MANTVNTSFSNPFAYINQQIRELDPQGEKIKLIANIPIICDIVLRIKYYQLKNELNEAVVKFKKQPGSLGNEDRCVKISNDLAALSNCMMKWGTIQRIVMLAIVLFFTPTFLPEAVLAGMFIYPFINKLHCFANHIATSNAQSEFSHAQIAAMEASLKRSRT